MKNVLTQYPALRASIYGVVAGTLTIASIFGFVTQDQLDAVLVNTGLGLGAVGSLLAILNLNGKKEAGSAAPDMPVLPEIDYDLLAAKVQRYLPAAVDRMPTVNEAVAVGHHAVDDMLNEANGSVADVRRRAEQAFGEYRDR